MTVALEELQDLRGVWASLSKIWTQIDDIREKPWLSVQPRKLRYVPLTSTLSCKLRPEYAQSIVIAN